jgi:hypothetical protein
MSAMPTSLLNALNASLNNAQHDWKVVSAVTHTIPSMPGLSLSVGGLTLDTGGVTPQTVTGGASSVTGPDTDALVDRTFQLQSDPLELVVIMIAHLVNGTFDSMMVYYRGTGFETTDVSLYNNVVAKADPEVVTIASAFESMIRKKFVTAALSARATRNFSATKIPA